MKMNAVNALIKRIMDKAGSDSKFDNVVMETIMVAFPDVEAIEKAKKDEETKVKRIAGLVKARVSKSTKRRETIQKK